MSKRICARCKSDNVIEDTYYGGTQYYLCESCLCRGDKESFPKKTLFHQIIASPEVLAEKLVYEETITEEDDGYVYRWRSTILPTIFWYSESEAFAATVAKLKEVASEKDNSSVFL